jgi:hypothetical protein
MTYLELQVIAAAHISGEDHTTYHQPGKKIKAQNSKYDFH